MGRSHYVLFPTRRMPEWETVFGEKPSWEGLPLINTVLRVASSVDHAARRQRDQEGRTAAGSGNWLIPTIVLGVLFPGWPAYEYTRLGFPAGWDLRRGVLHAHRVPRRARDRRP